ncbi:pyruvate, water dikinase [Desulfobulbus rhabdoformis]|uniref:PEP/pyruvate-binding domain-containing protein n=1 Tax=Desulfobulbus rhabdoformis TaxID=34032 RepID=UPI0019631E81|nr:PEP/pyruvate-binding domain-containing protein [Desulfobulbus rhabdoformis]MBM9613199.1 pyruvate, water dikinase [Desulfobulbus rhabdoformis]
MPPSLASRIKTLLGISTAPTLTAEELQHLFTTKYRCFRELLTANNNALEAMADLEAALHDGRTFSMGFVRSKSTVVTVNIYKMVQNLRRLADGGYANLDQSFTRIQQRIDAIIDKEITLPEGEWIIPMTGVNRSLAELTGEKMANLGEAGSLPGIEIPAGFAITSAASRQFYLDNNMYREINRIFQQTDARDMEDMLQKSQEVRQLILESSLPAELEQGLYQHFDQLAEEVGPGVKLAVRSSALGEDLARASFAGLYHTELFVERKDLLTAYKAVLASKYSPQAMSYRLAKGFRHEDIVMCVGCLAMIPATISGICYSQSLSGPPGTLDIFFADGLAKGIVDGTRKTDHSLIARQPPHALVEAASDKQRDTTILSQQQAGALAAISMRLEDHFGSPQDIEWSIDETGKIYVLQSRPISIDLFTAAGEPSPVPPDERVLLQGGVTGCRGVGSGPVTVVRTQEDMVHFPRKSVLVVEHPLPEWAPLLKRAVAMVAETGSEAGHLATLSREFGLPSLLALDQATTSLAKGEIVTVDAGNRVIYRGCIDELLEASSGTKPDNPMQGSPVQQILRDALALITPLTLTDPDSVYFRASHCTTMHDITRFCHEKSVIEMFDFGRRYRFAKGAAKRLVDNMPLEWWVINLSDGFSPAFDASAQFININDIVSSPMLALWKGMHAFPWQGPPAVSMRGMGAIVFQSAMNPALDPAVSSKLNQKNYFLVSRNYCNLSVRLGYHYAMIEAYISSLRTERYVTFRFKGGAADETRRVGRIALLDEILTRFNFRVERSGDAITARVEKRTQKFLFSRLQVLGYLTIHTRQIDMVMADDRERQRYRHKFIAEIEEMLGDDK